MGVHPIWPATLRRRKPSKLRGGNLMKAWIAIIGLIAVATLQGGCGSGSSSSSSSSTGGSSVSVPQFAHVFIVMEENHSYSEVVGNSNMPYLNSLITANGLATQYYADAH